MHHRQTTSFLRDLITDDDNENLLSAFSDRVLKVKLAGALPATLAGRAVELEGGWSAFTLHALEEVEPMLRQLRESGAVIERMEVSEPDLEQVFVRVMEAH